MVHVTCRNQSWFNWNASLVTWFRFAQKIIMDHDEKDVAYGLEVKCDQKKQVRSSMQEWLEKLAFIKMDMKLFAKPSKYGIKNWSMTQSLV